MLQPIVIEIKGGCLLAVYTDRGSLPVILVDHDESPSLGAKVETLSYKQMTLSTQEVVAPVVGALQLEEWQES
jgi:hypothetical protein